MIQIKLPQPLICIMLTLPLPTSTRKQILTIKPTLTINPLHPHLTMSNQFLHALLRRRGKPLCIKHRHKPRHPRNLNHPILRNTDHNTCRKHSHNTCDIGTSPRGVVTSTRQSPDRSS